MIAASVRMTRQLDMVARTTISSSTPSPTISSDLSINKPSW
jgi:hypothetical protein